MLPEKRTEEEQPTVERLKDVHRDIRKAASLLEEFARVLRQREDSSEERSRQCLKRWVTETENSSIPELKAFVVKLRQDMEAVVAVIVLPYSQGQTEGRINKLKLIKRSMCGRGEFDLLRRRVLYAAAS